MSISDKPYMQSLGLVASIVKKTGYALLALFMIFLAVMTYRYGGGFSDWKAIVVMVTMLAMAVLVGRIGFETSTLPVIGSSK